MGMGATWRHMRTDRSEIASRVERATVRRVFRFARPHRGLITFFLTITVLDAGLVVVSPLLVQHVVDDGILKQDESLVFLLAGAMAVTALVDALFTVLGG